MRPEHVAGIGPGDVDVIDVGYGPATEDGGGAGTICWRVLSVWRSYGRLLEE